MGNSFKILVKFFTKIYHFAFCTINYKFFHKLKEAKENWRFERSISLMKRRKVVIFLVKRSNVATIKWKFLSSSFTSSWFVATIFFVKRSKVKISNDYFLSLKLISVCHYVGCRSFPWFWFLKWTQLILVNPWKLILIRIHRMIHYMMLTMD